jgi:16S rRNA (uracil1498-N3)-methyltransferase
MRRFYIDQPVPPGAIYTISHPDANHIIKVLRMRPGDEIWLFDGAGHEFRARIDKLTAAEVTVEVGEIFACRSETPVRITIGQALLKNKKNDTVLRQLTELGMDGWIPINTERSIPKIKDNQEPAKSDRWQSIVRESVKQCQRGLIPKIYPTVDYHEALALRRHHDINIIFSDSRGEPLNSICARTYRPGAAILLLLGPEGGFTGQEVAMARQHGFIAAGLGPRILKADTAVVAACAIVQSLFGDMGKNDEPPDKIT